MKNIHIKIYIYTLFLTVSYINVTFMRFITYLTSKSLKRDFFYSIFSKILVEFV